VTWQRDLRWKHAGLRTLVCMQTPIQIVDTWMKQNGYALESAVALQLSNTDWQSTMAAGIAGRQTNDVHRDVDVLGQRCIRKQGAIGKCIAYLLIECKYIPQSNPWVLIGEMQIHEPKRLPPYIPRASAHASSPPMRGVPRIDHRSPPPISALNRVVSYGLKCADVGGKPKTRDREGTAFEALSKVKELAWSMAAQARSSDMEAPLSKEVIVIPCLVVKGPVTRVRFGNAGSYEVEEVFSGAVLLCTPPESTLIHVVRDTHFTEFITNLNTDIDRWATYILAPDKKLSSKRKTKLDMRKASPGPASTTT
jgi:hypothetical protein